jgi:hypothetical protein
VPRRVLAPPLPLLPAATALAAVTSLLAISCADPGRLAEMPGPAREGRGISFAIPARDGHASRIPDGPSAPRSPRDTGDTEDAAAANARCERCHEDIAAEWRASLHQKAHTDPLYARAFAIEPLPFCQGCHAPEADPAAPVPAAAADVGVGCVTCHVTGDTILAAPQGATAPAREPQGGPVPHAVTRDARFGSPAACAGCHEFAFPRTLRRFTELMQSTITEHRASPYASFACADCHMPREQGARGAHRSHRFEASRSPAMISAAAAARAERTGPSSIRVTLTAGEVGHAFPTGDLFRRLRVVAEATGDDFALVGHAARPLGRRFAERKVGLASVRTQIGDDRVVPGAPERAVDLDLGSDAAGLPIRWRVLYERVEHPVSRDGSEALVEGAISVAEGLLAP